MAISNPDLWQKIADWPLPGIPVFLEGTKSFQDRLQDVGNWSAEDTASVVREYRRFLYIKAATGETLTPPKAVDTAWHLHIEQVSDWMAFQVATGRSVPHLTGLIWPDNKEAYLRAHEVYRMEFDETPPAPVWPEPDKLGEIMEQRRHALWILALSAVLVVSGVVQDAVGKGWFFGAALMLAIFSVIMFTSARIGPEEISSCG